MSSEMSDDTTPRLCGNGLRLTFSADLAQKYTTLFGIKHGSDERQMYERSLDGENEWKVLGSNDFLEVSQFSSLAELDKKRNYPQWRSFSDVLVVPFEGHAPSENSLRTHCFSRRIRIALCW